MATTIRERITEFAAAQGFKTLSGFEKACGFSKNTLTKDFASINTNTLDRKARDLFLLGVYSCARFSDYSRLSECMIQDGVIHFTQVKTAASVMVPASPRLLEILARNGGHAPALAQQHLNEWIKRICQSVGITEMVESTSYDGVRHKTERVPKYSKVSSHCARRTGITLLYMTGIPLQQVMLISGHKDQDSIRRYLRLTKEENARMLKDNPFFN